MIAKFEDSVFVVKLNLFFYFYLYFMFSILFVFFCGRFNDCFSVWTFAQISIVKV